MRRIALAALLAAALFQSLPQLNGQVLRYQPTTTLREQTSNNTSASSSFRGANGNASPANVSKVSTRELLYPGANTRIYAHFMPWFGGSNHMNVGYRSDDPAQVRRQVADMKSRGIDGAIIDWYGPDKKRENDTTLMFMREAERQRNFKFAVMEDGGALKRCAQTRGCDVTQRLIDDLNYAYRTFFSSSAYLRVNGRPVVFFFEVDRHKPNWNRVRRNVRGNPLFIDRHQTSFGRSRNDGAYAWIGHGGSNRRVNHGYWDEFYREAHRTRHKVAVGSVVPGFDNRRAGWGTPRVTDRECGKTWRDIFERVGRYYSAHHQLPFMQIVTWNDYAEGTAIEPGIDNCVRVRTPRISGTRLSWDIEGSQSGVHHFTIYVSRDGERLMKLADVSPRQRDLRLENYRLEQGNYRVFVQAVGQPSLRNQMSPSVGYNAPAPGSGGATSTGGSAPAAGSSGSVTLEASPRQLEVRQGRSANLSVRVRPSSSQRGEVTLACSGLPANSRCEFSPARVNPAGKSVSVTMTVHTAAPAQNASLASDRQAPLLAMVLGLASVVLVFGAMLAASGTGPRLAARRRVLTLLGLLVIMALVTGLAGCGGTPDSGGSRSLLESRMGTPVGAYTITIIGATGSGQNSTTALLTVRQP